MKKVKYFSISAGGKKLPGLVKGTAEKKKWLNHLRKLSGVEVNEATYIDLANADLIEFTEKREDI